jgi:plastocyanin
MNIAVANPLRNDGPKLAGRRVSMTGLAGLIFVALALANMAEAADVSVEIPADGKLIFAPDAVSVSKGDVIVWTNKQNRKHNVTPLVTTPGLDSSDFTKDQTRSLEIKENLPPAIEYECTLHPDTMRGKITIK